MRLQYTEQIMCIFQGNSLITGSSVHSTIILIHCRSVEQSSCTYGAKEEAEKLHDTLPDLMTSALHASSSFQPDLKISEKHGAQLISCSAPSAGSAFFPKHRFNKSLLSVDKRTMWSEK